jgi:hypothetical protein
MMDYIIGGLIFGLAAFLIIRNIIKMKKGQSCCCEGCDKSASCCSKPQ